MVPFSESELHSRLRKVFEDAGYRRYKMSKFEEYDLYAKNKDFLVSGNVITFTDTDGRLLALKPDVTLSIIKNAGGNGGVEKVYYHENVYRSSGGAIGFREIAQAGLECIGEVDEYSVCEVLSLAAKSLLAVSQRSELDISHLGLILGLMDSAGLKEAAQKAALELIGGKNLGELRELLAKEEIESDAAERIAGLASLDVEAKNAPKKLRELLKGYVSEQRLEMFVETCEFLSGEFPGTVRVDFSTVGDPGYYSGLFFKGYVDGVPAAVLSGGQYDGLMKKLGKKDRAIGFAIYLDMLEPLFADGDRLDADVLLVYGEGFSPKEIYSAAEELSSRGRVAVLRSRPQGMRFGKIFKLTREGAVEIG